MTAAGEDQQAEIWETIYGRVRDLMRRYGNEDYLGRADYWVLSDNYGFRTINVAIHRLDMLQPIIIESLQMLLTDHPDWEIVVALDIPGKENVWPEMDLVIRAGNVIDRLQRQYLPKALQDIEFAGGRRR